MSRQFETSSSRAASSSGTAWTSSMASQWTKPSRRSTNSSRSTRSARSSRWASQDFSERTQWWKALQRQRNLGPAGPRQSMQTDDPVSRCGPGKGTQSSISLPEVKILYLKDLSLDDGEDGDNQLERPDHPPEGAPR